MTVKELMEILKDADPDMEVVVIDRSCPFLDNEHKEYEFDEDDVTIDAYYYCVTIGVN